MIAKVCIKGVETFKLICECDKSNRANGGQLRFTRHRKHPGNHSYCNVNACRLRDAIIIAFPVDAVYFCLR